MKFLIDAQLPPGLAKWLRGKGYEAVTARDLGLREASDPVIWERALAGGYTIVTKDQDFAALATSAAQGPCVFWVRTGNLVNRLLLASFERAWREIESQLVSGATLVELR